MVKRSFLQRIVTDAVAPGMDALRTLTEQTYAQLRTEIIEGHLQRGSKLRIGNLRQGYGVGTSICEMDKLDLATSLLAKAKKKGVNLLLPVDNIIGKEFAADTESNAVDSHSIPDDWMGLDIGPKSIELFSNAIKDAKTVVWNGPMGVFEMERFAVGTKRVAEALANSGAISIVGGGDSAAAVEQLGFADKITHISTGGGASLEFLEGKELPGIAVLNEKK